MDEVLGNSDLLQLIFSHCHRLSSFGCEGFDPSFETVRRQNSFSQDLLYDDGSSWFFPPDILYAVKLVSKQWNALITQQLAAQHQQAFDQLRQNVWTRMERRNTARAQLSAPQALYLDTQLTELLKKYNHSSQQVLQDGWFNTLLEQGASPSQLISRKGYGFSLARVFSQALQISNKTMGDFVMLAELVCAAEVSDTNCRMEWSRRWISSSWVGVQVADRLLECMAGRHPPWCGPWDMIRLGRRSFGLFRVALMARLFHFAHFQAASYLQPNLYQQHQQQRDEQETREDEENEPPKKKEWVEDLSILYPTSTPMQVAQIIVEFSKHNPLKRRRRALLKDIIALLQLSGIPLQLKCCEEGFRFCSFGTCLRHPVLPQDLFIVHLLRQSAYANDLWRLLEEASCDGEKKIVVTAALLKLLKKNYGRKDQRKKMKQVLLMVPEVRGWIVEEAPDIIQELCRMRCREFLEFFLKHERERMAALLPALLEFLRSDQVGGLKAKLICTLERASKDVHS